MAVQGCEHVNRALVVEREVAIKTSVGDCECTPDLACREVLVSWPPSAMKDPVEVKLAGQMLV